MIIVCPHHIDHGQDWALYFSCSNSLVTGMLLDRGIVLRLFRRGGRDSSPPDAETRMSNYHVTGDYWGRTGTGISKLPRWNGFQPLTGINDAHREQLPSLSPSTQAQQ